MSAPRGVELNQPISGLCRQLGVFTGLKGLRGMEMGEVGLGEHEMETWKQRRKKDRRQERRQALMAHIFHSSSIGNTPFISRTVAPVLLWVKCSKLSALRITTSLSPDSPKATLLRFKTKSSASRKQNLIMFIILLSDTFWSFV